MKRKKSRWQRHRSSSSSPSNGSASSRETSVRTVEKSRRSVERSRSKDRRSSNSRKRSGSRSSCSTSSRISVSSKGSVSRGRNRNERHSSSSSDRGTKRPNRKSDKSNFITKTIKRMKRKKLKKKLGLKELNRKSDLENDDAKKPENVNLSAVDDPLDLKRSPLDLKEDLVDHLFDGDFETTVRAVECPTCNEIFGSLALIEYHAILVHKVTPHVESETIGERNEDGFLFTKIPNHVNTQYQPIINTCPISNCRSSSEPCESKDLAATGALSPPLSVATPDSAYNEIPELELSSRSRRNTNSDDSASNETHQKELAIVKLLSKYKKDTKKQADGAKCSKEVGVSEVRQIPLIVAPSNAPFLTKPGNFSPVPFSPPMPKKVKPVHCPYVCPHSYEHTRVGVIKHMLAIHNPYRNYANGLVKCPECVVLHKPAIQMTSEDIWQHFCAEHLVNGVFDSIRVPFGIPFGLVEKYTCGVDSCSFTSFKWEEIVQHDKTMHTSNELLYKEYECTLCNKTNNNIIQHTAKHHAHPFSGYQCPLCQDYFNEKMAFIVHVQDFHEITVLASCEICCKKFENYERSRMCYLQHWRQIVQCIKCNYLLPLLNLQQHRVKCVVPLKQWM